jgi:hypothetical protein
MATGEAQLDKSSSSHLSGTEDFGIDVLGRYKHIALDPSSSKLSDEQKSDLLSNISLLRDTIVYFTASGAARGVSGHTGGPYDTVPEVCILLAFFQFSSEKFLPVVYDESGHRVATQYLISALRKALPFEHLLHYREANSKLPGHPELGLTPGVQFSSGRLGHLWAFVNGVAMANPEKTVFMLGSDGAQQEGDDDEAARLAVAQQLNVKLILDDNDVCIFLLLQRDLTNLSMIDQPAILLLASMSYVMNVLTSPYLGYHCWSSIRVSQGLLDDIYPKRTWNDGVRSPRRGH